MILTLYNQMDALARLCVQGKATFAVYLSKKYAAMC